MELLYYGKDLDECLDRASKELKLEKSKITYKIVKKNVLFNKSTVIKVKMKDNSIKKAKENVMQTNEDNNTIVHEIKTEKECGIAVIDRKIVVICDEISEKKFTIRTCKGIDLFINKELCRPGSTYNVLSSDEITYKSQKTESERKLSIKVSNNHMEVYGKIEYIPKYSYRLFDTDVKDNLVLKARKEAIENPPKYKVEEIVAELKRLNVSFGILYDEIIKLCNGDCEQEVLIAKGQKPVDDIADEIKMFFDNKNKARSVDDNERIDYRNRYSFTCIEKNNVLAERIPGKVGQDGKDVYGKNIKRKTIRNLPFKAGKGCKLENNKIISTEKGMPIVQNGTFFVNPVYSVKDVNMKTGNINFGGNIEVNGSVSEGMEVSCKGILTIKKDVTSAKIKSNGNIEVNGNIIDSTVLAGGYDIDKKNYNDILQQYNNELEGLILSLDKMVMAAGDRRIGELMEILIENRYKDIPKMSLNVLTCSFTSGIQNKDILDFIRNKMIGLNAFKIENMEELHEFKNLIEAELEYLDSECEIPVDVTASYIQNSNIVCTGKLLITGKGSYISSLRAFDSIECSNTSSIIRGGVISAKNYLKLSKVGSEAGVVTNLKVDEDGVIEVETAHNGTVFCFGKRQKILTESSRKVKAYLDKDGQIQIEKLKL